jgi:hypothetical protein
MGSFQACDALNVLFKLKKPLMEHLEGFILLSKEHGELQKKFRTINRKFQLKNSKNSPIGAAKVGALMVGGMFVVALMSY